MNKCSQDLMLLIIEESTQTSAKLDMEIMELGNKLKQSTSNLDIYKKKVEEISETLKILNRKIGKLRSRTL